MELATVFGERLKNLRIERGISQKELADALGLSRPSIGYYEMGDRLPDIGTLVNTADYFNVSTEFLTGRTEFSSIEAQANAISIEDSEGDSDAITESQTDEIIEIFYKIKANHHKKGKLYIKWNELMITHVVQCFEYLGKLLDMAGNGNKFIDFSNILSTVKNNIMGIIMVYISDFGKLTVSDEYIQDMGIDLDGTLNK